MVVEGLKDLRTGHSEVDILHVARRTTAPFTKVIKKELLRRALISLRNSVVGGSSPQPGLMAGEAVTQLSLFEDNRPQRNRPEMMVLNCQAPPVVIVNHTDSKVGVAATGASPTSK